MENPAKLGSWGWLDLSVEKAEDVRDFYSRVCGWDSSPVDMGGYDDFNMMDATGETVAGVCHARQSNAVLPPMWIPYIAVADAAAAVAEAKENGGTVIREHRQEGGDHIAWIKDPAGACFAVWEKAAARGEAE